MVITRTVVRGGRKSSATERGVSPDHVRRRQIAQTESRWREWILAIAMVGGLPTVVFATHEADHRFTVEGFVCGADGKSSPNIEVLVKDTKISYGQIVKKGSDRRAEIERVESEARTRGIL